VLCGGVDCGVADEGCAVIGSFAIADPASLFGDEDPDFPAAYAVMCVRISISFARVASSIIVLDAPRLEPEVPVAPVVLVLLGALVPALSLPTSFVMMRSIAATSVPQLFELADAVVPPRLVGL
jgi:hypothetical protein